MNVTFKIIEVKNKKGYLLLDEKNKTTRQNIKNVRPSFLRGGEISWPDELERNNTNLIKKIKEMTNGFLMKFLEKSNYLIKSKMRPLWKTVGEESVWKRPPDEVR
ncbi:hypothetical protein DMUE_3580 [Dictyocoela muelleri]|nr:hypothetical protein DMUE_3580 [Dictyocoela muelleri]